MIDPILATLDDSMSDREKAEVLVQAICDRFVYSAESDHNMKWPDPVGTTGPCGPFAHAVLDIFNAADIPCLWMSGDNHAWTYAYLDGQWYVVDASRADVSGGIASMGIIDDVEGYRGGPGTTARVAMALIESAYN